MNNGESLIPQIPFSSALSHQAHFCFLLPIQTTHESWLVVFKHFPECPVQTNMNINLKRIQKFLSNFLANHPIQFH